MRPGTHEDPGDRAGAEDYVGLRHDLRIRTIRSRERAWTGFWIPLTKNREVRVIDLIRHLKFPPTGSKLQKLIPV